MGQKVDLLQVGSEINLCDCHRQPSLITAAMEMRLRITSLHFNYLCI